MTRTVPNSVASSLPWPASSRVRGIPSVPVAGAVLPGLLFFPRSPQVQVVLQQLPQQVPAPLVQVLLELAGGHPGCNGTSELSGQAGEHAF